MGLAMDYDQILMRRPATVISTLFFLAAATGCATDVHTTLVEAQRGDPGSVRIAVIELGVLLSAKEELGYPYDEGDQAAIRYLREVAEQSKDALNRANAIDSLRRLKRPEFTDLYLAVLRDPSWVVQIEAVKALKERREPRAVKSLSDRLEDDIRMEVRVEILKALAAIGGAQALESLLFVFLDPSDRYENMKLAAYDGLRLLSSENFAFQDKGAWEEYQERRFPEAAAEDGSAGILPDPPSARSGTSSVESESPEEQE